MEICLRHLKKQGNNELEEEKIMIRFEDVSKEFIWKKDKVRALHHIDLTIEDGEIYGIVGFSGAGKSTLVRMINGLEKPTSGRVIVDGRHLEGLRKKDLRILRKKIGMVFQQFNLLDSKSVYDNIAMPLILNKTDKTTIEQRVRELLEFVELSDKINVYPNQLSGGQKQRVGIARALATNPDILLCDEATSALDPKTTDSILELLKKINEDLKITIVIITHEMHVIQKVCDKVAVMDSGSIIESGTVQQVFATPKEQITKGFINMVVKEDIPREIRNSKKLSDEDSQVWSIKYWGENQTFQIMQDLKEQVGDSVTMIYHTTSCLQDYVLNILIIQVKDKRDRTEAIRKTLEPYQVLAERKYYED